MKKTMTTLFLLALTLAVTAHGAVIITGIMSGTLTSSTPKAIELYVSGTEDLTQYQIARASNGGAWSTTPVDLSGTYTDAFVYVVDTLSSSVIPFQTVFGTSGDFANIYANSIASCNGNDAFRIIKKSDSSIIDQFGDPIDAVGNTYTAPWAYQYSYAYRRDNTGPDAGWNIRRWTDIPGNGTLTGMNAAQIGARVPFGTFSYDPNNIEPNLPSMTYDYGWENFTPGPSFRETVLLGTYYAVQTGLEITNVHTGSKALWISEDGTSGTGEGYVAWIKNLQPTDYIYASCYAKSYAGSAANKGVRMWAHYTYGDDISNFAGEVSGSATYSDPNNWTKLNQGWIFPTKTYTDSEGVQHAVNGMVIKIRTYSAVSDGGYVDDLSITVPDRTENTVSVVFPSMTGDAICVGGLPTFDFNHDCKVDLTDFVEFAATWLDCNLQPSADCSL